MTGYSQEYLTSLNTNALINTSNTKRQLTSRAGDSLNIVPQWDNPTLPFTDDFSTDKRRPIDLTPFIGSAISSYYMNGQCVEEKKYKRGQYKFSKDTTYFYFYNPLSPPDYVDSGAYTAVNILVVDNIPNCNLVQTISFFPTTYRYTFNSNGTVKDSSFIFDTIISCAYIYEVPMKNYIWIDRHAYLNSHLPYFPPSKGVATLDGLNQYGRPYDTIGTNTYGVADYLTTAPIDLSTNNFNDSIYLSFMYQPQGYGDCPQKIDSLVVQFSDSNHVWHSVKSFPGFNLADLPYDSLKFKHCLIPIPQQIVPSDPNFFHDSFQFRFKNYATISGNNDHWHLDFIKLDKKRNPFDTVIIDANFVYELPTILKNYTLLPAKQYQGQIDLKDTLTAWNRNIPGAGIFGLYKYLCKNEKTNTTFGQNSPGIPYRQDPLVPLYLKSNTELNFPLAVSDSTTITTKIYLDQSDVYTSNDTATHRQLFFNEMAYDDGTAEAAYGVEGLGIKKIAYKFLIPRKDTLAAIKILFSNIDYPVNNLLFNLNIWKSIGYNGQVEKIVKTRSNLKPIYRDTMNGFITFGLDTPIEVQDTIYVGWTQTDERNIQIGFDRNNINGRKNLFLFAENKWSKSNLGNTDQFLGSPMIRLILDGKRNYRPISSINSSEVIKIERDISIYPNPASDFVNFESDDFKEKEISIFDLLGKKLYSTLFKHEFKADLSELNSGMYIVCISENGQRILSKKLQIVR